MTLLLYLVDGMVYDYKTISGNMIDWITNVMWMAIIFKVELLITFYN